MRAYTDGRDSAWVDFTKGLGYPVGAVPTAAALYALDHRVERLAAIARTLAGRGGGR
ncbi:hypothetical protein BTI_3807 [Burkholderia thailandensis MSMB121]|uniref:hypothetical protein n=1 Tax=Burkholderia humptydooensis TaxID=430531 RepID=UPI0003280CD6|nr:hypothetical protein [Burkholderia humptydooensis]AGK50735.1 hypothetical protein BTI_3807 [Burkholderia thailandensis MSMB121]